MIHISKLENRRVEKVEDVLNIGDIDLGQGHRDSTKRAASNFSRKDALKELANADKK